MRPNNDSEIKEIDLMYLDLMIKVIVTISKITLEVLRK